MADNLPEPEGAPSVDASPAEGQKSPTGRLVVSLSSVAKTPPPLPTGGARPAGPPKHVPPLAGATRGTILPARVVPATPPTPSTLNRTMEVILPPKTGVLPKLTPLTNMPTAPARQSVALPQPGSGTPPPLPATQEVVKRPAPFKLKAVPLSETHSEDSIFAEPDSVPVAVPTPAPTPAPEPAEKPQGWKHLEPGELPPLAAETGEEDPSVAPLDYPKTVPPLVGAGAPPPSGKLRLPPAIKKGESAISKAPALTQPSEAPTLPPPLPVVATVTKVPVAALKSAALPPPLPSPKPAPATAMETPASVEMKAPEKTPAPPPLPASSTPPAEVKKDSPPPLSGAPSSGSLVIPAATAAAGYAAIVAKEGSTSGSLPRLRPPALPRASKPPEEFSPLPTPAPVPAVESKAVEPIVVPVDQAPPIEEVAATPPVASAAPVTTPPLAAAPMIAAPLITRDKSTGQVTEPPPPVPRGKKFRPAPVKKAAPVAAEEPPAEPGADGKIPLTRAERAQRRRFIGTIAFYAFLVFVVGPLLYILSLSYSSETRVEGQVIPPPGTLLCNEVWIVSDFRGSAEGVSEDLALARAPKLQEIQERQDHVQRAQADIAAREERIHLLNDQIQAAKDEIASVVKQAHDAAQHVWDGPGAALENDYQSRLNSLQQAIAARAKSLNLNYQPDPTYQSPEVWANAYRLALYQTPPGVDGVKEHQWIEDQLKAWRDYTKSFDDQKEKLRLQAAQIQLSPTTQVNDLNDKIEDLQHRIDSTQSEEDPLKTELQQAQADLAESQTAEAGLDDRYYEELYSMPKNSIIKRLPVLENGRFTWPHVEKDSAFAEGEKVHNYWIFARAVRPDGRQFWALSHFAIGPNSILPLLIEPDGFVSTKAILRPDLSPDEQAQ